eukprot:s119_g13.t1
MADRWDFAVRGPNSASDPLAQKVRRVRTKTLLTGRKAMRFAELTYWETTFPNIWQRRVNKEIYIPAAELIDMGERWQFAREPKSTCMLACELCGFEMNARVELRKHLEEKHVAKDAAGHAPDFWTAQRVVEEYRKRMVHYEQTAGKF